MNTFSNQVEEHVMVCLSAAPSNAKNIRTAAAMATAFHARFTALFVETAHYTEMAPEDRERLQMHKKMAAELGAVVETVHGDNVPFQIAEYARVSGVTQLVLGRSALTRKHLWGHKTLTEELLDYVPYLNIYIIPDQSIRSYRPGKRKNGSTSDEVVNAIKSLLILLGATGLGLLFFKLGLSTTNIIMVYILGVLLTSVWTASRFYSLLSSIASVVLFNYLFIEPTLSLAAYGTGYPLIFFGMFLTAYISGSIALRYQNQAGEAAKIAYRSQVLFDSNQLLSKADDTEKILETAGAQVMKLLRRSVVVYENRGGDIGSSHWHVPDKRKKPIEEPDPELIRLVMNENHAAGAGMDTGTDSSYYLAPIRINERNYGVMGIWVGKDPLENAEQGMLLSVLGETALAMENQKNARDKEAAAVMMEREQLRAELLRTISHDLRTPLTSISGNASNLLDKEMCFDEDTRRQIYSDIYQDSVWLIKMVENLLFTTRIEDGRMSIHLEPELVSEILEEVKRHVERQNRTRQFRIECPDELLMIRADAKLLMQVLVNLVDNAIKYTPEESPIRITGERKGDMALLCVRDNGPGISDEEKDKIFEKFYCGERKIADNRRSLGLGLYLCKVIVEAQGGTIRVEDNDPCGAAFCLTIPLEDISNYETLSDSGSGR